MKQSDAHVDHIPTPMIRVLALAARPDTESVLREWLTRAGTLAAYAAGHPDAESLQGRGTVFAVPSPLAEGKEWVVRHYHRGGALARVLGDRYVRLGTPRPVREYALGQALAERGVATPAMVGAAVYPAGAFYRGDLVTERVAGASDLARVLFGVAALPPRGGGSHHDRSDAAADGAAEAGSGMARPAAAEADSEAQPEAAMWATGRLIRRAHDAGLVHPDLNLKNILVTAGPEPRALVLDLDRGRLVRELSERARRRMLDRFWRSARKWERRTGRPLADHVTKALAEGYAEADR